MPTATPPRRAVSRGTGPLGVAGRDERARLDLAPQRPHVDGHFLGALIALLGVLGHRLANDALEFHRQIAAQEVQRSRLFLQDGVHHFDRCAAPEGLHTARQLVKNGAEREDVGACIHRLAAHLLRGHVTHGAHDQPGQGGFRTAADCSRTAEHRLHQGLVAGHGSREARRATFIGFEELRETEIEDLHQPVGPQHDVLGLQVAVHDAGRVRHRESLRHLNSHIEDLANLERPAAQPETSRSSLVSRAL
jgi:hypothetical protein